MGKSFEIRQDHWATGDDEVSLNVWYSQGPTRSGTAISLTHAEMRDMIRVCEEELARATQVREGSVGWLRRELAAYDDEASVRIRVEDRDTGPIETYPRWIRDGAEWDETFAGEPVILSEE